MIYTLTLAPAVDMYITTRDFNIGGINHPESERFLAGGKGINVSIMLKNLNRDSICLGFTGGFTGDFIKRELDKKKIKHDFIDTKSPCRINIKIDGAIKETAFNALSPIYSNKDLVNLREKLLKLKNGDYLIISGASARFTINDKVKDAVFTELEKKGVNLIVDMSKSSLLSMIKYHPFMIKPNKSELEEIFYTTFKNENDIIDAAKKLVKSGAKNVIVSLGEEGALLVNDTKIIKVKAPKGKVIKTVGSGDSLVAGFLDEYIRSNKLDLALARGVLVGSASAFSKGIATKKEIDSIEKRQKQ